MRKLLTLFLLYHLSYLLSAQHTLPIPDNIQAAYQKGTRDASGKPGVNYWQNKADYNLNINFNPKTREVKGTVTVVYVNNSPDTLTQLWFKLYPNIYKKGVERKVEIAASDVNEGLQISAIKMNGKTASVASFIIDGTNMHTTIDALAPKQKIKLQIDYSYFLNKGSSIRTGQVDEGSFFLAYFFPRITVYDDIDGWNKYPYDGPAEFYNDFSDFDVAITVPGNYMVWATGDLQNAEKVYTPIIAKRLKQAEKSDETISVVNTIDWKNKAVIKAEPFNTWKFKAQHVTDFTFAVSNQYIVKSTSLVVDTASGRRTRVDAVYNPAHKSYEEMIDFSRKTVHAMSYKFPKWPYPYSHVTVFDGLDEMEYPMLANINPVKNRYDAITLIIHEIFHTMFPFYVGINETKYGWMDEGWAAVAEWFIAPLIEPTFVGGAGVENYAELKMGEKPMLTVTHELDGTGNFANTYLKPTIAYFYLQEYLGHELFIKALHYYISQWAGKHPMPFDFFNCMNKGAGKNLDWYWKSWFFTDNSADMAIKEVIKENNGYSLQIENKGGKPLPIALTCTYADGSTEKIQKSIGVWEKGERVITLKIKTSKAVQKIEMGSVYVPDKNKTDNVIMVD